MEKNPELRPLAEVVPGLAEDLEIHQSTYEWSVRVFSIIEKLLRVNIKLHHRPGQIEAGHIFLFNHFARFETFIPQYLIYRETGALCRSVAAGELFSAASGLSNYLLRVGVVPNSHPKLFPLLAAEILRGRKVVIFPEGGMVKDRAVVDRKGRYSVYSRSVGHKRKHHTGAAVLALILDIFKATIRNIHKAGHERRLQAWAEALRMDDVEALLAAVRRPTLIVPANITFYPIRVDDHILRKGAEVLSRGLSRRLSEELLIEGNILLRDTDMDVRLGEPVQPSLGWWEHKLAERLTQGIDTLDGFFGLGLPNASWNSRLIKWRVRRKVLTIRDAYMYRMYPIATVNLSHLASRLILSLLGRAQAEVPQALFHKTLYLAVKEVQGKRSVYLHRSLKNPDAYGGLLDGHCAGFQQFLSATVKMGLVAIDGARYRFLPKLARRYGFDEIRLENLVAVYANEVAPIREVARSIENAIAQAPQLSREDLARLRFEDEVISYAWDRRCFSRPRHEEINRQETATEHGGPFLLLPPESKDLGVVLVHGFLASPAEVRSLGQEMERRGYPVVGVRLKGHGTSPWDLRERKWQEWLDSVRRSYAIMSGLVQRIFLVGFSTGGALSLRLAAERPVGLVGTVAISVPLKFQDPTMIFVPLVHAANQLARWVSSWEGLRPFHQRESEHPHINYRNIPTRGLYELRRMADDVEERLPDVQCPVLILQGDEDQVVDPRAAQLIHQKLGSADKRLVMVPSKRHGILCENIGGTQETILSFMAEWEQATEKNHRQDAQDAKSAVLQ